MIRAAAFEAVGGYCESLDVAQDYELWNRLLTHGTACNIVQPLMELRRHQKSVSTRSSVKQIDTACAIQASLCGDLLEIDDFSKECMEITEKELLEEKAAIEHLLKI